MTAFTDNEKILIDIINNSKDVSLALAEAVRVILCYLEQPESFRAQAADLLQESYGKAG